MVSFALCLLTVAPDPALMNQLGAHADRLERRSGSVLMSVQSEELDADGKVKSTGLTQLRVTSHGGRTTSELVKVVQDGKDVTEARRTKAPSDDDASFSAPLPFASSQRAKYAFTLLPVLPTKPEFVRIGFQPTSEKSPELLMGEAWVDPAKGELIRLWMRPSKNPPFVDHLVLELELEAQLPDGRAISRLDARGDGGVLFIRKRFHVDTRFSEYR